MPISLEIDTQHNVVIRRVENPVTESDMNGFYQEYYTNPDFKTGMSILWDFRGLVMGDFSGDKVVMGAINLTKYSEKRGKGGLAFVIDDIASTPLADIFRELVREQEIPIAKFDKYDEAFEWCIRNNCVTL